MSTTFPNQPSSLPDPRSVREDPPQINGPERVDPLLVQETKQQIRELVQEIAQLCQSEVGLDEFYDEFLHRVVSALASVGGVIWTVEEGQSLELQYQINLAQTGLPQNEEFQQRHAILLQKVLQTGTPSLAPPQSGPQSDEEGGNPTDYLLVLACIRVDEHTSAIVEIFQRATGGPTTQRGYLRFLTQMCELAGDYFRNRRLRVMRDRQQLLDRLERFLSEIHRDLDLLPTLYAIANEGREVIGVDRVSIAIKQGHRCQIEVVSGLDAIDRRAEEVKRLSRLATLVTATDETLWYNGDTSNQPPQIERALQAYVDKSHSKQFGIIPLRQPARGTATSDTPGQVLGALVVERSTDSPDPDGLRQRTALVAEHGAAALSSALQHDRLFLMPVWRALGKLKWIVQARQLPKTTLAMLAAVAIILAFVFVEQDFEVAATGKLHPAMRRDVFAPVDGTVIEVPVRHAQQVQQGQLLTRMENSSLEYDITTLHGQLTTTREQISVQSRAFAESYRATPSEQRRLGGVLQDLRQTEAGLVKQLDLLLKKRKLLEVKCEFAGQVVTWQVADNLLHRPVQRGQVLMTVVDPNGPWELELLVPEKHMGHVNDAALTQPDGLHVGWLMSSHPGETFTGRVVEIQRTAHAHGEEGNTVLIRVAVDKHQLPDLRNETSVTAKIGCGQQPIGFVWFHDLIETFQSKVLFWL